MAIVKVASIHMLFCNVTLPSSSMGGVYIGISSPLNLERFKEKVMLYQS